MNNIYAILIQFNYLNTMSIFIMSGFFLNERQNYIKANQAVIISNGRNLIKHTHTCNLSELKGEHCVSFAHMSALVSRSGKKIKHSACNLFFRYLQIKTYDFAIRSELTAILSIPLTLLTILTTQKLHKHTLFQESILLLYFLGEGGNFFAELQIRNERISYKYKLSLSLQTALLHTRILP